MFIYLCVFRNVYLYLTKLNETFHYLCVGAFFTPSSALVINVFDFKKYQCSSYIFEIDIYFEKSHGTLNTITSIQIV